MVYKQERTQNLSLNQFKNNSKFIDLNQKKKSPYSQKKYLKKRIFKEDVDQILPSFQVSNQNFSNKSPNTKMKEVQGQEDKKVEEKKENVNITNLKIFFKTLKSKSKSKIF